MSTEPYAEIVREYADGLADIFLKEAGWCECTTNRLVVRERLLPVVEMFQTELDSEYLEAKLIFSHHVAIYMNRMEDDLARGLHRPQGQDGADARQRESANHVQQF